jgi:hypothetical protein
VHNLKQGQIFTPPHITNQMLDVLGGDEVLANPENFFFEPSCGDGQMLLVIIERIFNALMNRYDNDIDKALSECLFKFYAFDLDAELVIKCRHNAFNLFLKLSGRELNTFEQYCIANSLQSSIEFRDALSKQGISAVASSPGRRAINRKGV